MKQILFICFAFLSFSQTSKAQCTNPQPTGAITQTFCKTENKTVGGLAVNETNIVWYIEEIGGIPHDNASLLQTGFYYADDKTGDGCSVARLTVEVFVYGDKPNANLSISECARDNPTIANLFPNGNNYDWYDAEFGGNLLTLNTPLEHQVRYWVGQTENGCASERSGTFVTLLTPVAPQVQNTIQTFCAIEKATITNLVVELAAQSSTLVWYDTETSIIRLDPTELLVHDGDYWAAEVEATVFCESLGRTKVSVILNTTTSPVKPNSSAQSFCEIDAPTIGNLQITGTTVKWYASLNETTPLNVTDLLVDGVDYYATQTDGTTGCESLERTVISVIVKATSSPILSSGNDVQTFCNLNTTTIADIAITGTAIKWYASASSTTVLLTTDLLVNDTDYFASQTDATTDCESLERTKVSIIISSTPAPTLASGNATQTFCNSSIAAIADIIITGTNIQWYDSLTSKTVLNTADLLVDSTDYYATQTDNTTGCESLERTKVTIILNTTSAPALASGDELQVFCEIDTATIAEIAISGTAINWYATESSTTVLASTDILVNNTDYYATQTDATSGCESLGRTKVSVTINTTPAPILATGNDTQTFCNSNIATVADIIITGTNIQWYASLTSTTVLNVTDLLVNGTDYYATQTDNTTGCESLERTKVTIIINTTSAPALASGDELQVFCEVDAATIAEIAITGTAINWYATESSTTVLASADLLVNNTDYYATQTDATSGCESLGRIKVSVTINTTPAPILASGNDTQTFCNDSTANIADITITGTNIKWYASLTSTTVLNTTDLLVNGVDYYATQTDITTGCESLERTKVASIINTTSEPTFASGGEFQVFCEIDTATIAEIIITGTAIKWYASASSTTVLATTNLLVNGTDYYATQTDATSGCESLGRIKVSVTINTTPAPILASGNDTQTFCNDSTANIADITITGTNIKWYASLTSTTVLNTTDLLVNGVDYYATQTDITTGCESLERTKVTVIVNTTSAPTVASGGELQVFCEINTATIADMVITGTNIKWFATLISTNELALTEALIDGEDYYATQTEASGCASLNRTKIDVTIITSITAPTTIDNTPVFCESNFATIASLEVTGTNLNWYETLTSTAVLETTILLEDNKSYFVSQTSAGGCESIERLTITVALTKVPKPILALNGAQFCALKGDFMISELNNNVSVPVGYTTVWYDDFPNGNILSLSDILVDGHIYYAVSEDLNGCESIDALKVEVDLTACNDDDLVIYDGFSPNNDGINDVFTTKNIELVFPNYTINFYNRWGNIVYQANASKPFWNGRLNGNGELLPKGIYYYILDFNKDNRKPKQGNLYLSR